VTKKLIKLCDESVFSFLIMQMKRKGDQAYKDGNKGLANHYYKVGTTALKRWEKITGKIVNLKNKKS
jgi:hypothetical protein